MTNEIQTLSDKDIKDLVKAYVEFKAAEAKFKALKEQLTKHIAPGKHTSKYGVVNKIKAIRTSIDYNAMLDDHPEIDVDDYTTEKEVESVTITSLLR